MHSLREEKDTEGEPSCIHWKCFWLQVMEISAISGLSSNTSHNKNSKAVILHTLKILKNLVF